MHRVRRSPHRPRLARAVLLTAAAMFGISAYIACSDDPARYEPIPKIPTAHGVVVAGQVQNGAHAAVKGAIVSIEAMDNGVPATAIWLEEQAQLAGGKTTLLAASDALKRVTVTDDRGRFVFDGMPAGDYAMQVRADDHLGAFENVAVPSAALTLDTIIVDVNLTPTGTFSGFATLENATSHQNIVVYAEGTSYVAVTDPTGAYAITDVPVGSYDLRAMHAHYLDDTTSGTLTFAGQNLGLAALLLRLDNNIPPVAIITIPPQTMETDIPITFQSSGTDADGSVVYYEWDFENDGTMDTGSPTPGSTNHTYTVAGNYTVKLRVTDNQGAIGLAAETIEVVASTPFVAIHMSPTGSDTDPGTEAEPVATLAMAYTLAQANNFTTIKVAEGSYGEVPVFLDGIDVEGGYDATWTSATGWSLFYVDFARATAHGITSATTISRLDITTDLPAAANSIAMVSTGSTAALLFENCAFRSWDAGSSGAHGGPGANGPNGGPGQNGGQGSCDGNILNNGGNGGTSLVGCPGGKGGSSFGEGNPGQAGAQGGCSGGTGGNGGGVGDPGFDGQPGGLGADGVHGSPGSAASPNGSIVAGDWEPGTAGDGSNGTNGRGGGGGGAGGGQTGTFIDDGSGNGGGGGGGGGFGSGGAGGKGGYGSIAVLLIASSPTFQNCIFDCRDGGVGRNGGNGGTGGTGGPGGSGNSFCNAEVGEGGDGGDGGDGGAGGGGAGGAGGPSIGIVMANGSAPTLIGVTYILGVAGAPGSGGVGGNLVPAPTGAAGVVANTLSL